MQRIKVTFSLENLLLVDSIYTNSYYFYGIKYSQIQGFMIQSKKIVQFNMKTFHHSIAELSTA